MSSFLVFAPYAGLPEDLDQTGEDHAAIKGKAEALRNTRWMAQQTIDRMPDGFLCSQLLDDHATRARLEDELTSCEGLAFYGHGTPDGLAGVGDKPVVDEDNVTVLTGRWVHALACQSGNELADMAVAAGAHCFAGYEVTLITEWVPEDIPEPILDAFSELVTITTFNLAAGIRDRRTLARAANSLAELIVAWCNSNPDAYAGLFEVTAQQLAGALVFKQGS